MDTLIDTLWNEYKDKSNVGDIIYEIVKDEFTKSYVLFKIECLNNDLSDFIEQTESTHSTMKQTMVEKRVYNLTTAFYYDQGTQEWLNERDKCISASDAGTTLGMNKYSTRSEIIKKKCGVGQKFTGNKFTEHGHKYEDVAAFLYQSRYLQELHFFGLILHKNPLIPIGASPDGISANGVMLEIKVPMCRQITGEVPIHYEIQTQVQMEVCELYECDFYENRIVEYDFKEDYDMDGTDRHTESGDIKGMIGQFYHKDTHKDIYIYPPMWCTSSEAEQWITDQVNVLKTTNPEYKFDTIIYWRLEVESCVNIKRDHDRMHNQYVPEFTKVWDEILFHRKTNGKNLIEPVSDDEDDNNNNIVECAFDSDSD